MDIGQLLANGGSLFWRHRFLWLFGVLGVAGTAILNAAARVWLRPDLINWLVNPAEPTLPGPGGIITFIVLIFLAALLVWLLNVLAEGGLIFSVAELEAGRSVTGREIGQAMRRSLVPFVAVDTLLFLPLFLVVLLAMLGGTAFFVAFILGVDQGVMDLDQGLRLMGVGLLACVLPLLCLVVPVLLVTLLLRLFAFRAVALDQAGARESIRQAWNFVRHRPGPILLLAVVLWVINQVVSTLLSLISGPLEFAAWQPLFAALSGGTVAAEPSLLPVADSLVASLLGFLAGSILFTYGGAVWTLAYQRGKTI